MCELKINVVPVGTVENPKSKKYVVYQIMIQRWGDIVDPHAAVIQRRYTDFLKLFTELKKDHAQSLNEIQFPKKVYLGNFDHAVINSRSIAFATFLQTICLDERTRTSQPTIDFFSKDLTQAYRLLEMDLYEAAKPVVENTFWLLSKLLTDRTPPVMRTLCLLVAITAKSHDSAALSLATLAVQRFQAISDVDLLKYYVPLLLTAQEVTSITGQDVKVISQHLEQLKKKGMNMRADKTLFQILMDDLRPSPTVTLSTFY